MQLVPLDLLPYSEFGQMRLGSFVPPGTEIVHQSDFEWMGGLWLHEGIGFTWFGRLMTQSDQTAGLEVFFEELDETSIGRILRLLATAQSRNEIREPARSFRLAQYNECFRLGSQDLQLLIPRMSASVSTG